MKIKGFAHKGSGESSVWMPRYIPYLYPGTLNLKLEGKKPLITYTEEIDTDYGKPCKVAPCKINGEDGFVVWPPLAKERKSRIEIGATFNIREKFNLKDGDSVIIEL